MATSEYEAPIIEPVEEDNADLSELITVCFHCDPESPNFTY